MTGSAYTQRNFHRLGDTIGMPNAVHEIGFTPWPETRAESWPTAGRIMREDDVWYCQKCGDGPHGDSAVNAFLPASISF